MKKWWIALGIEVAVLLLVFGGYYIYQSQYNKKNQQIIAKQQEMEQKGEKQLQDALNAKVEEENRIQRLKDDMVSASIAIDEEYADWLYENYAEVCEEIALMIEDDSYEDKVWHEQTGKSVFVLKDEYKGILNSEARLMEQSIYRKESASSEYA